MSISQKTKDALAKKVGGQFKGKIKTSSYKAMDLSRFGQTEVAKPAEKKVFRIKQKIETPVVVEEPSVEEIVETVIEETPTVEATIVEPETVEETIVEENQNVEVFTKPVE